MAVFYNNGINPFPAVAASTGLPQYTLVAITSTGGVDHPTAGAPVSGVLYTGSTYSTNDSQVCDVMPPGAIVKVKAAASTLGVGDGCAATTAGTVTVLAGGDYRIGTVFAGSSGGANRVISVLLDNIGTT
jgi:hypothetical protein